MNTFNPKHIFVTGADGFIGSHLVEHLIRANYTVTAMVMYNAKNHLGWLDNVDRDVVNAMQVVAGDIRDIDHLQHLMSGADTVLHLAALIGIPYSYHSPRSYIDTNVLGTLNVLQAAMKLDVGHIIHTSTSEVYGTAQSVPISEDHPLQAQSPYAASKIAADQLALSYYKSFATPVTVLRPFNTYGPRQSARAIIPTVISQLANGAESLKLGNLTPTRDFSYVTDTVNGFISAMCSLNAVGEVLNLGSGFEVSIEQTVQFIAKLMDKNVTIVSDHERLRPEKSEVQRLLADNSKMQQYTDWKPYYATHDDFCEGLKQTIAWFTEASNLSQYKSFQYNV